MGVWELARKGCRGTPLVRVKTANKRINSSILLIQRIINVTFSRIILRTGNLFFSKFLIGIILYVKTLYMKICQKIINLIYFRNFTVQTNVTNIIISFFMFNNFYKHYYIYKLSSIFGIWCNKTILKCS